VEPAASHAHAATLGFGRSINFLSQGCSGRSIGLPSCFFLSSSKRAVVHAATLDWKASPTYVAREAHKRRAIRLMVPEGVD
jgi:hypothetical protein